MLEINVPIWLLVALAGLPALLTAAVFYREIRKSRTKDVPPEPVPCLEPFGVQVRQQLLEQQVDGVFTALSSILEAERAKFKKLLNHSLFISATQAPTEARATSPVAGEDGAHTSEIPVSRKVALLTTQGKTAAQVVRDMDISHAEVALALKMEKSPGYSDSWGVDR
jgi:hypothetical protein